MQGTGLGLPITKSIVDLMGGAIEVLTSPGSGTEIIIRIKFKLADEKDVQKEGAGEDAAEEETVDFSGKRLLLVEDNAVTDTDLLEQIGELLPYYTTFNKLANDALRIGIPILLEKKKYPKPITLQTDDSKGIPQEPTMENAVNPQADRIIQLLSDIVINTMTGKRMLEGLYNLREEELQSESPALAKRFGKGLFNHTPDCLFEEEVDMLKELYPQNDDEK